MILEKFDKKLAAEGCSRDDMLALETTIKVKLVAVDALGYIHYGTAAYTRPGQILPSPAITNTPGQTFKPTHQKLYRCTD